MGRLRMELELRALDAIDAAQRRARGWCEQVLERLTDRLYARRLRLHETLHPPSEATLRSRHAINYVLKRLYSPEAVRYGQTAPGDVSGLSAWIPGDHNA